MTHNTHNVQATKDIVLSASDKSTLKHMSSVFVHNEPHPCVSFVANTRQVTRACIKTMVLTGTYPLQCARFKMKKTDSAICLLCKTEKEDAKHFVETCKSQEITRRKYMGRIQALLPPSLNIPLIQAYLDSRTLALSHPELKFTTLHEFEQVTRDMVFALHISRTLMLDMSN